MFYTSENKPLLIEDSYKNQSCFLVLSGPSLAKVDLNKLRHPGIVTFGVNNSPKAFRPDLWTLVDEVGNFMISIWKDPKIKKFVPYPKNMHKLFDNVAWKETSLKVNDCPNVVYYKRNEKFNHKTFLTEDTINWGNHKTNGGGRSVMLAAIRIIHLLGFKKVFLLGCDFKMDDNTKYAFTQDRSKGSIRNNNSTYQKLNERFTLLRPEFEKSRFYVWNCTEGSGLKAFDYMSLDLALKIALKDFPDVQTECSEGMYEREAKLREIAKSKRQGVVYYNAGKGCLVRLAVSLSSCRKVYSGAITILCDKDSYDECKKIADYFKADCKTEDFATFSRNSILFNKTLLHKFTPYETNVYIDSDTLVIKDFSKLFKLAEEYEFVTTQFADWKPKNIAGRINEWKDIVAVDKALAYPYAINTGVFAFTKKSSLMKDWFDKAVKGEKFFIPDELSCQIMLPDYKHFTAGASFNTSCRYGRIWSGTRIIHFHGKKHCRIKNGKYLFNSKLWYQEFDTIKHLDFVKDNIEFDNKLKENIGFHDSNRSNA